MQQIKAQGMRFVDEQGRERIFHGVNLKGKVDGSNIAWLDEAFFKRAAALGQRLLRLGVRWAQLEPQPGQYNEEVLKQYDQIFNWGEQYGVYIFLDMHQDLYGSFGGSCGDGAPDWATLSDGIKRKKTRFVWAEGYFWSRAVHRAFDHFWRNTPVHGKGLQDHYAALWQMLAARYGNHPALFGWNIMNEPFPGTPGGKMFRKLVAKMVRIGLVSPSLKRIQFLKKWRNPDKHGFKLDVLTPKVMAKVTGARSATKILYKFEQEHYGPFIAKMGAAIREVTPKGIIIFDQCYYCNLGIPTKMPLPQGEDQICFDPHGYDFMVDTPAYKHANNPRVGFMFEQMRKAQLDFGLPVVCGEWGGGGEGESFLPHIGFLMDLFDSWNWSNCYFTYGPALFNNPITRYLSRPYPWAVNGTIDNFNVDMDSKTFTLNYTPNAGDAPTEIFLPDGYESVQAGDAQVTYENNLLSIRTNAPQIVVKYK
ncbi:MAG: cellulase family glycosylhydrolase [Oscillospiraceae bacterium]|nr:cellulase family glycosylhydrolase [Oscillospiraceae bacterium]